MFRRDLKDSPENDWPLNTQNLFPYSSSELPQVLCLTDILPEWTKGYSFPWIISLLSVWWFLDSRWWNLKSAFNETQLPSHHIFCPFSRGRRKTRIDLVIWFSNVCSNTYSYSILSPAGSKNSLEVRWKGQKGRRGIQNLCLETASWKNFTSSLRGEAARSQDFPLPSVWAQV